MAHLQGFKTGVLNETAIQQFQNQFDRSENVYSLGYTAHTQALAGQHYTDALLSKGIGLMATQQLNQLADQTQDSTARRLVLQVRNTRLTLKNQLNQPPARQRGIDSLQRTANRLEQELLLRLPAYAQAFGALRVEWPQVQQALRPDEAAIEFVQFAYYHNWQRVINGKKVWRPGWTDSTFYAAVVLRPGWSAPRFVVLTEARALDTLVALKTHEKRKTAYVERLYTVEERGGVVSGADAKPQPALYPLIWQPIDSLLTGVKRVYYAPAGMLHRLNLAALPINARQRVGEKYTLTLLASTRQIALPPLPRSGNRRALLLGGIQYERDSVAYRRANTRFRPASPTDRDVAQYDTTNRGDAWGELSNTGPEIASVRATLAQQGYQSDTLTGLRASEEAFYALTQQPSGSPNVLHIATHGFFYEAPRSTTATRTDEMGGAAFTQSKEALVRSGLVLAGGNAAWERGQVPTGQEDGILTAYEVSLLPLNQTELVVLSACETGLGDLRGSEGVYGLQRAFKMAGTQNILMSLWQVPDKATRVLLETFYKQYLQPGNTVRSAFDEAVRQVREQYTEPYFWAGFVLVE